MNDRIEWCKDCDRRTLDAVLVIARGPGYHNVHSKLTEIPAEVMYCDLPGNPEPPRHSPRPWCCWLWSESLLRAIAVQPIRASGKRALRRVEELTSSTLLLLGGQVLFAVGWPSFQHMS